MGMMAWMELRVERLLGSHLRREALESEDGFWFLRAVV